MYLARTPFILKKLYPSLTWNKNRKDRVVYLTFDDGPIPEVTPFVLEQLHKYQAKATFFCIGDNVRKNKELFEQILNKGHAVGNHTFNHLNGWNTPADEYVKNVFKCDDHFKTRLFRPPYGRLTTAQIRTLKTHFEIIMWDVLSGDFDQGLSAEKCLQNVLRNTGNGSIIVFHDSLKAAEKLREVLPQAIATLASRGFKFGML